VRPARGLASRVRLERYNADGSLSLLDEDAENPNAGSGIDYRYETGGALATLSVGGEAIFAQEVNLAGQVLRNTNPEAGERAFLFDAVGNLVKSRDPVGVVLVNHYDAINRLTSTFAEGEADALRAFHYDDDPSDPTARHLVGRVAFLKDEGGQQSYRYDAVGNIIQIERQFTTGQTLVMAFEHDDMGQLMRVTYPNGRTVDYDYNEGDLVRSIGGLVDSIAYGTDGQPERVRFANGATTQRWFNPSHQMERETVLAPSGVVLSDLRFTYDPMGSILSWDQSMAGQSLHREFEYDSLLRLTEVRGEATVAQQIEYDAKGNITTKSDQGQGGFEYDDPDAPSRLTGYSGPDGHVALRYDAAGRVIEHTRLGRISYDHWGRPTKCEAPDGTLVEYEFGYGDVLIARHVTQNGQRSSSLFFGGLYEESADQSICSVLSEGNLVGRIIGAADGSSRTVIHHADLQGSVYLMTDATGAAVTQQDFDPWGRAVDGSAESFYIGRSTEQELGLVLLGNRLYDPSIGRFLAPDDLVLNRPEGFSHGSQLLNPYAYGANNPVRFRDPSGRILWVPLIIGVVVGGYLGYQTARENGTNPWTGALIGGIIGGLIGGFGGYPLLGSAAKGAAISAGTHVLGNYVSGNGLRIGEGFWTSVSLGFVFGAVSSVAPDGVVTGKGAWVDTQNIAIEVGRGALLGGVQGAVQAQLTGEDAWDGFTKGLASGAVSAAGNIALKGIRYDALSGPDPQNHGFARDVHDQYKIDTTRDNSRLAGKIAEQGLPDVQSAVFRRGGLVPWLLGGRSMVFGSNVMMASGQEYNVNVVAHELRHIHQIQLHGSFVSFLLEYGMQALSPAWEFKYTTDPRNTTYEVYHKH